MTNDSLLTRIENFDAKICVIGLGQVGLPTALIFAKQGFDVTGHDINKNLLATLNSKKIHFEEEGLEDLLKYCMEEGRFHTNSSVEDSVKNSDVIIVCVLTPLTDGIKPDLSYLQRVCNSLSEQSIENKLIIIESSIPPGTFRSLVPTLEKKYKLGKDFWMAFVPERLAPGKALSEIPTTARIIGHIDTDSGLLTKLLYEKIVNSQVILSTVEITEISKLVENTFRDVNVAFANEVGLICETYGIDAAELIAVCNSHPRVKVLQPGPGVGGPCLPKDPYLLLNPQGKPMIDSKLILDSRKINDNMPFHVIDLIKKALASQDKKINEATISVLGVAYKANISDTRFSPAKEIISQLVKNGCNVLVFDPKSMETFGGNPVPDVWQAISSSDALVIITDHDEFKMLDLSKIKKSMKERPILIDTRRIFPRKEAEELGFQYIAVGYVKHI